MVTGPCLFLIAHAVDDTHHIALIESKVNTSPLQGTLLAVLVRSCVPEQLL